MKKMITLLLTLALLLGTVAAAANTLQESPIPTIVGDVNGNGKIGADDALEVLRYCTRHTHPIFPVVGVTPTQPKPEQPTIPHSIADVDDDDRVEAEDALYILKRVVGKNDCFPGESKIRFIENQEVDLQSVWAEEYSEESDSLYAAKIEQLQEQYGTVTKVEAVEANHVVDTVVKNVQAGIPQADVVELSLVSARNLYRAGGGFNLANAPLRHRLQKNGATSSLCINQHLAGVSINTHSTVMGVVYNKDLLARYAPDVDLESLVTNQEWTFDKFRSLATVLTVDTDQNGKTDIYGFTSNTNVVGMAVYANVGGTTLLRARRVEAMMCDSIAITAMDWCKDMFKTDKSWLYKADINQSVSQFVQGKAGMFVSYASFVPQIAQTADFEVGFVPMPMGPKRTNYVQPVYETRVYVIPKNSGHALNKVCGWWDEMLTLEEETLAQTAQEWQALGLDEPSIQNYQNLVRNNSAEFSSGVFSTTVMSAIDSYVSDTPTKDTWEKIKSQAQKEADDYYAPFYE